MSITPFYPFIPRKQRALVTREPDVAGRWNPLFPEMIGYEQEGGGSVPPDFHWRSNPKQFQEELTNEELRQLAKAHHALSEAILPQALPEGMLPLLLPSGKL